MRCLVKNLDVGDKVELITDSSFTGVIIGKREDGAFIVQYTDKRTYEPIEIVYDQHLLKLKNEPSGFSLNVIRR